MSLSGPEGLGLSDVFQNAVGAYSKQAPGISWKSSPLMFKAMSCRLFSDVEQGICITLAASKLGLAENSQLNTSS